MQPDEPLPHVRPRQVVERRERGERVIILDVREPFEHDLAHVEGTLDIPMGDVPERLADVPRDGELVVMCHHGMRSAAVARWLRAEGYDAVNLAGGIDAWANEVDPDVGTY